MSAPGKDPALIRAMFDAVAPRYDLLNHLLSLGLDRRWRRVTARRLARLGPAGSVLDVATGTGDLLLELTRTLPRTTPLVGLDVSRSMLSRAAAKRAPRARPILLLQADALRLPFPDASLGAVTIAFGLRNLPDLREGVRELVRVVRPGGLLAVLEFTRGRARWAEPLFRLWSRHFIPRAGRLLSDPAAYRYLPESIEAWVTPEGLRGVLKEAGAPPVEERAFTGGVCTLVVGQRTVRDPS